MRLNVNPTRMELLKLRRRIAIARRGHKLLKDKQDELMRTFMKRIDVLKNMRQETEELLRRTMGKYIMLKSFLGNDKMSECMQEMKLDYEFTHTYESLLSVRLPRYEFKFTTAAPLRGYFNMPYAIDSLREKFKELMLKLIRLAQEEQTIRLLAEEIGKTRRRVNALEHILIPNLIETMHYITMKLTENERGTVVRLMKIKDIVRKKS